MSRGKVVWGREKIIREGGGEGVVVIWERGKVIGGEGR